MCKHSVELQTAVATQLDQREINDQILDHRFTLATVVTTRHSVDLKGTCESYFVVFPPPEGN